MDPAGQRGGVSQRRGPLHRAGPRHRDRGVCGGTYRRHHRRARAGHARPHPRRLRRCGARASAPASSVLGQNGPGDPRRARDHGRGHWLRPHRAGAWLGGLRGRHALRPASREPGGRRRQVRVARAGVRRHRLLGGAKTDHRAAPDQRRAVRLAAAATLIPALLAPQDAGNLPRHAPVVRGDGSARRWPPGRRCGGSSKRLWSAATRS